MTEPQKAELQSDSQWWDDSRIEAMDFAGHELAMRLRNAYLAMHRATNACFSREGLSADSFTVLTTLNDFGPMMQKDLVQKIGSDANTVSAMLARLEKRDLISRKRDANDGRARIVDLTDRGRDIQKRLWEISRPIRLSLVETIERNESQNLIDLLKCISSEMPQT